MRLRIIAEDKLLSRFLNYAGDYIEVYYLGNMEVLLSSEFENNYFQIVLGCLHADEEFPQIRFPKSLISKLTKEKLFDIEVRDNDFKFSFFNSDVELMYSISTIKQMGVLDNEYYLALERDRINFSKFNFSNYTDLILTLSKLKLNLNCVDGIFYSEFMRAYIYRKVLKGTNLPPNFSIPSANLVKLFSISYDVTFFPKHMYVSKDSLSMFIIRERAPLGCELLDNSIQPFTHSFNLNLTNLKPLYSRITLDKYCTSTLDASKEIITINSNDEIFIINVKLDKLKTKKKEADLSLLDSMIFNNFDHNTKEVVTDLGNSARIPKVDIPKWVLTLLSNAPIDTRFYISTTFVRINLRGYSVLYGGKTCQD